MGAHGPFAVNALAHRQGRKPFGMRSYEKCVCKRPGMSSYEIIELKVPWNEQLQERGGGAASSAVPTGRLRTFRSDNKAGRATGFQALKLQRSEERRVGKEGRSRWS